jgi:hypothetical protein
LAEVPPPETTKAGTEAGPEALTLQRPSYAKQIEELSLDESSPPSPSDAYANEKPGKAVVSEGSAELAEALPPGEPEAIADRQAASPSGATLALDSPLPPSPSESLANEKPQSVSGAPMAVELKEPEANAGAAVVAEGGEKPSMAASPSAELESPNVPSPSEAIAGEKPKAAAKGEQIVTLEPAEPRPPVAAETQPQAVPAPAVAPAAAAPAAVATINEKPSAGGFEIPSTIPVLKGLAKGSFYIQVGVFSTNEALSSALKAFKLKYPLAVESLTTKSGGQAYRLFVGPLNRDESGVVLVRMRSLGFKDAYIRQGS